MIWLYVLSAVALLLAPLAGPFAPVGGMAPLIQELARESGIPNLVSGVILHTRLFDTIGEVLVFTLASIGVRQMLGTEPVRQRIRTLTDIPSRVVCGGGTLATGSCGNSSAWSSVRGDLPLGWPVAPPSAWC